MSFKDAIDPSRVRRILVVKLLHHGDVLLTSPVFSVLKHRLPDAHIDALVYADTAPMLLGHPDVSRLWTLPRQKQAKGWARLKLEWRLLQNLRAHHYDLLIHLTKNRRGAWLSRLLSPIYSVAPAGSFGKFFARSFSHRYTIVGGNRRHTVESNLDALRRLGISPPEHLKRLSIELPLEAQQFAKMSCEQLGIFGEFVLVHPTSRWLFKAWDVEKLATCLAKLDALGVPMILTAAPDGAELNYVAKLQSLLPRPLPSLAGKTSLKELAALIARAKVFLGMDSVPMHLAAACQTPTVALFGPSGDIEWAPWRVDSKILTASMTCRPCGRDGCGGSGVSECLNAISVEAVISAVLQFWEDTGDAKNCDSQTTF